MDTIYRLDPAQNTAGAPLLSIVEEVNDSTGLK